MLALCLHSYGKMGKGSPTHLSRPDSDETKREEEENDVQRPRFTPTSRAQSPFY